MSKPIHCIVDCLTCGKRWEGINDRTAAKKHAQQYGHRVSGEIAYSFEYDYIVAKSSITTSIREGKK